MLAVCVAAAGDRRGIDTGSPQPGQPITVTTTCLYTVSHLCMVSHLYSITLQYRVPHHVYYTST